MQFCPTSFALSLTMLLSSPDAWAIFNQDPSSQSAKRLMQDSSAPPTFDSKSAFNYLVKQTQFGPRGPGLAGHERCLNFLQNELKKFADDVQLQQFPFTLSTGKAVLLTNIMCAFNSTARRRIVLSAHWDTRLWADQDSDPKNHKRPILGANDGASGVAVLLEIARQMRLNAPSIGVDIVLFDGEDLGTTGRPETFSAGAKYFARNRPPDFNPRFGINIDMIGDRELRIPREVNSDRYAPELMNLLFSTARDLDIPQFIDAPGSDISDDHLPLNEAGIRTVNLIDFAYPDASNKYWHTLADTPDKCSSASLAAVGRVLLAIIYSKASFVQ